MDHKKVVVIDTGYDSYEYEKSLLTEAGYEFAVFAGERKDIAGKMEFARGAIAVFARHTRMDEHFFRSLMKKRPILINTARGPVVDQESLLEALRNDTIHSAGLDVYSEEPPGAGQQDLLKHPYVISTGHYAWYSESSILELQRRAAHNMLAMLSGEIPQDWLNP